MFSQLSMSKVLFSFIFDPLIVIGMLLVIRSGLVEEDAVEAFHYYGYQLSSSLLI